LESLPFGGQVLEVTEAIKSRSEHGSSYPLECRNCGKNLKLGERFFNRRGTEKRRTSRIYCIACAKKLGFIVRPGP